MSPVTRIARRKRKQNRLQNIAPTVAVFVSLFVISLLVFFEMQTPPPQDSLHAGLPFTAFMGKFRVALHLTIAFLLILTALTLRIRCAMQSEDHRQTLAVLTSIGATRRQRRAVLISDITGLYLPPAVAGVLSGILPGIRIGQRFWNSTAVPPSPLWYAVVAVGLVVAAVLLIGLCVFLPHVSLKRTAVIQSVKKQNPKASEERHGYRRSRTYRTQTLLKRLAKKSTDYHAATYTRIALSFAASALYPLVALWLFWCVGDTEVILDNNPYDGIDTTGAVLAAMDDLFRFLGWAFLLLAGMGLLQTVLMARTQIAARRKSAHTYLLVGMPPSDIRKMIRLELSGVVWRSAIMLLFFGLVIGTCYGMI